MLEAHETEIYLTRLQYRGTGSCTACDIEVKWGDGTGWEVFSGVFNVAAGEGTKPIGHRAEFDKDTLFHQYGAAITESNKRFEIRVRFTDDQGLTAESAVLVEFKDYYHATVNPGWQPHHKVGISQRHTSLGGATRRIGCPAYVNFSTYGDHWTSHGLQYVRHLTDIQFGDRSVDMQNNSTYLSENFVPTVGLHDYTMTFSPTGLWGNAEINGYGQARVIAVE